MICAFDFDKCVQRLKVFLNNKEAAGSKWKKNTVLQLIINRDVKLCRKIRPCLNGIFNGIILQDSQENSCYFCSAHLKKNQGEEGA